MTKKELILDSLADSGDYGECETQILEYFKFTKIDISIDEIRILIAEMIIDGFICAGQTWKNEHGEKPYSLTPKGRVFWTKQIRSL